MTRPSRITLWTVALATIACVPAVARAQGVTPAAPAPGAPAAPKVRRSVEIRAQAPAPEVITVRPREVPQYTRRLLVPALIVPPDTTSVRGTVSAVGASVVVPAPASAEARAVATPDRRTRTP